MNLARKIALTAVTGLLALGLTAVDGGTAHADSGWGGAGKTITSGHGVHVSHVNR